jgi:vancomycin aglycone glucosyltransferase
VNRWLWRASSSLSGATLGGPINRKRRQLGLEPVTDWYQHFFPTRRMLIAADPELAPMPQNVSLPFAALGSLHLPDERPLSPVVEQFLSAGPAPVYIGFGSMRDPSPDATTALFMAAARAAHMRLVLSAGWARYGGAHVGEARSLSDDVLVVGPSSHALLFPRLRAVVHHGGAGTTSAALRAGRPQVVVPHAFDQFQWARWVHSAGLGPEPIARKRLSVERLARALSQVSSEPRFAERAEALMRAARKHDPVAGVLRVLSQVVAAR